MKTIIATFLLLLACSVRADDPQKTIHDLSIKKAEIYSGLTKMLIKDGEKAVISETTEKLKAAMKDPDSTKFRNVRLVDFAQGKLVCGEVNSKNSYGGYVGFKQFYGNPMGYYLQSENEEENAGLYAACGR